MAPSGRYEGGFWDWVRKPSFRRMAVARAERWFRRRSRTVVLSDRRIRKRIADLWNPDKWELAKLDLEQQGERAVPALVEALERSTFVPRPKGGPYRSDDHPLESILDLLGEAGATAAVAAIAPFVLHDNDHFRKWAGNALGMIGADCCVEPVRITLRDSDEWVRSWTLMGIERSLKYDRADEAFLLAVFTEIITQIAQDSRIASDAAYRIVLTVDRERAVEVLLSDGVFRSDRGDLYDIIEELSEAGVTIPADRLKGVMAEIKAHVSEFPQGNIYGEALLALARQGDPEVESLAREAAAWGIERVSKDGARAIALLHGVGDLWTRLCERVHGEGITRMNARQWHFFACQLFDFEVCNGGVAQFYANSSGIHARHAAEGFEAMGATEAARIVNESMALFGPDGPSRDWQELEEQLSRLGDSDFEAMDRLSDAFFKTQVDACIRTYLYAAAHAAEMLQ